MYVDRIKFECMNTVILIRVLLEKLIVAQSNQEISRSFGIRKNITVFTAARLLTLS
jgi:hypothetical protein